MPRKIQGEKACWGTKGFQSFAQLPVCLVTLVYFLENQKRNKYRCGNSNTLFSLSAFELGCSSGQIGITGEDLSRKLTKQGRHKKPYIF